MVNLSHCEHSRKSLLAYKDVELSLVLHRRSSAARIFLQRSRIRDEKQFVARVCMRVKRKNMLVHDWAFVKVLLGEP